MKRLDLNRVWDDAKAMGASNRELLLTLAGMFLLLPTLIALELLPDQKPLGPNPAPEQIIQSYSTYISANWHILFGRELVIGFGTLAMLALLLNKDRPTVGESMRQALVLLPGYVLAQLLAGLALIAGFMAFILPFFYLLARFALVGPVAAAEKQANPIEMLRRSIALSRGNGWRIFAVLAILFFAGQLATGTISIVVGLVASFVLPADLARLAEHLASSLVLAGLGIVSVLVTAALYREATSEGR